MLRKLLTAALRTRRGRSGLAAAGVAGSALMVLVLAAAYRSLSTGVVAYAGQAHCDLWVAPKGTDNLIRSGGYVPSDWEASLRAVPGVAAVDPLLRTFVSVEGASTGGRPRRATLLAIGHRGPTGLGGPPMLASGRAAREPGEIVLDRAAAFRLGVVVGDAVRVQDETLRVVGLARGTNLIATQFVFGDYVAVEDALGLYGRTSFFAVRLADGMDRDERARAIERQLPQASVMTSPDFVANNLREVAAGFLPLLAVLTSLGLGVASALVGLLAQGLVEERRTDLAVLLALGAGLRSIAAALASGVGRVVSAGMALGAAAAWLLGALLERWLPTVELTYRLGDLARVSGLFAATAVVATLVPLARLGRVDPLEAFRP